MPNPTAPGVYVSIGAAAPSPNQLARTGTWFVTGEAQVGPTGVAIPLQSMSDYANFLGSRPGYTQLFDSLDEFFHDGGTLAYVSRVVGSAAATPATLVLKDRAATPLNTLTITANGDGAWANSVTVTVTAGTVSNTYVLTITDPNTNRTWISPNLTSPADAVTWAQNTAGSSPWAFPFTITNDGSATTAPNNNPAVLAATAMAGGADDLAGVAESDWTNALTAFHSDLGPGQVSAPGHNTQAGWEALVAHASATDPASGALTNNRFALLDGVDSSSASTVVSQVAQAQAGSGDPSFAMFLAPWVVIPGVPPTTVGGAPAATTRVVPPSAMVAALMAANDAANTADNAAAGANGQSSYATGLTQTYVEADRGTLNTAGVAVIRQINGNVQLYGYRTIATNPLWVSATDARMRMELVDALNTAAEPFAFRQIDGQGHLLAEFNGSLAGVCQDYWQQGALYGATPGDAFQVNTGTAVNTPATIAAGQLNATVSVRFSPFAEFTQVSVTKYSVAQSLPA